MNESLTTSRPGIPFSGKTHNNHPQWYNEPLRLTEEQRNDPFLILYEFFQSYHLNDTREILWDWLTKVVTNSSSVSDDPHYRHNQFYFYEKIEELIEAALLITKSVKLKEHKDPINSPIDHKEENIEIQGNPPHLIEYADTNPLYVLQEIFNPDDDFIIRDIKEWLLIGLSADSTVYDDGEQRNNLIAFHDHLIILTEALFVITLRNLDNEEIKNKLSATYAITELSAFQVTDPEKVIEVFFDKFPIKNSIRELDDWFKASLSFSGEWRGNIICLEQVWDIYRNVQCLIRCAKQLSR